MMNHDQIKAEIERLHKRFDPEIKAARAARRVKLKIALTSKRQGKPNNQFRYGSHAVPLASLGDDWRIELPSWCRDQRNQMTGPADDLPLIVKMLNSGAPGVMLDLEDSMVPDNVDVGIENIIATLHGDAEWKKPGNGSPLLTKNTESVIFIRPRGLHMTHQWNGEKISATLYDVANVALRLDVKKVRHPLSFYIPKTESAAEGFIWRSLFRELADAMGVPSDYIKCMALVESAPLAYEMNEFIYVMRDHIMGLNLGRWDYMASLIHWNMENPDWVLPDRNLIAHDVPFFQQLRRLLVHTCHKRGILAIGGMTAMFPSRVDDDLNERALGILKRDKANEAALGFDGAWTGHPDQNAIALKAFPVPNQLHTHCVWNEPMPDLQIVPDHVNDTITLKGTRIAIKTAIRYRYGVLRGKGAMLLDGFMEDLATDRIYRLMIAQRIKHWRVLAEKGLIDNGDEQEWSETIGDHSIKFISGLFELLADEVITEGNLWNDTEQLMLVKRAALKTLESIVNERFDPE